MHICIYAQFPQQISKLGITGLKQIWNQAYGGPIKKLDPGIPRSYKSFEVHWVVHLHETQNFGLFLTLSRVANLHEKFIEEGNDASKGDHADD